MSNRSAISLTERGWPRSSRRMPRRCGSARAWNAASLTTVILAYLQLLTYLSHHLYIAQVTTCMTWPGSHHEPERQRNHHPRLLRRMDGQGLRPGRFPARRGPGSRGPRQRVSDHRVIRRRAAELRLDEHAGRAPRRDERRTRGHAPV